VCKAGEGGSCVVSVEAFEEGVPGESDGFEEEYSSVTGRSPLLYRFSCNGGIAGILACHAQRNDFNIVGKRSI